LIFLVRNKIFLELKNTSVVYYFIKQKLAPNSNDLGRGCLEKPDAIAINPRLEELCFKYTGSSVKASKKVKKSYKTLFQSAVAASVFKRKLALFSL